MLNCRVMFCWHGMMRLAHCILFRLLLFLLFHYHPVDSKYGLAVGDGVRLDDYGLGEVAFLACIIFHFHKVLVVWHDRVFRPFGNDASTRGKRRRDVEWRIALVGETKDMSAVAVLEYGVKVV